MRGLDELAVFLPEREGLRVISRVPELIDFTTVVTDMRMASTELFDRFRIRSKMIGIDEGGRRRNRFDYLIDTLPLPKRFVPPNAASPGLLDLPETRRDGGVAVSGPLKVLIVFGGEDPAGLTEKTLRAFLRPVLRSSTECFVLLGPIARSRGKQALFRREKVTVLPETKNLKEKLHAYDVVLTSFGITAFEAAYAGCGVICVNPSLYHHRLSRLAGFTRAGIKRARYRKILLSLSDYGGLVSVSKSVFPRDDRPSGSLGDLINSLDLQETTVCPLCGRNRNAGVYRDNEKTVFYCPLCGLYYQTSFYPRDKAYDRDYFFTEYKKQYGKTYLEDFQHILSLGRERIRDVLGLLPKNTPSPKLLDVGCAYGAFLTAAADAGFSVSGSDISETAAEYVRETLGLPVEVDDFERGKTHIEERYDVLTMWFVLEHFKNLRGVLPKVKKVLKPGGIFAFSTPNAAGISGKHNRTDFFKNNPKDHYTIWTPKAARRVLRRFGFRVVKIKITGHHPERFPGIGKAGGKSSLPYNVVYFLSRLRGLGDTFEVYAVKRDTIGKGKDG